MTLVFGTNCGLISSSQSADPDGYTTFSIDTRSRAMKITTTDAVTITEMAWYCTNATEEANYDIGIYSHNSGSDVPDSLLYSETNQAKGTTAGWKKVTGLNWSLSASTTYWVAVQVDDTATTTTIDINSAIVPGTSRYSAMFSQTSLASSWSASTSSNSTDLAIYALYSSAPDPDVTVTPSAEAMTLSIQSPTINVVANRIVTPSTLGLTLSVQSPTITNAVSVTITPDAEPLNLSVQSPTINTIWNTTIEPVVEALSLGLQSPIIEAIRQATIQPDATALNLSLQTPFISTGKDVLIEPSAFSNLLGLQAPAVTTIRQVSVDPNTLETTLTLETPTISATRASKNRFKIKISGTFI